MKSLEQCLAYSECPVNISFYYYYKLLLLLFHLVSCGSLPELVLPEHLSVQILESFYFKSRKLIILMDQCASNVGSVGREPCKKGGTPQAIQQGCFGSSLEWRIFKQTQSKLRPWSNHRNRSLQRHPGCGMGKWVDGWINRWAIDG